MAEIRRHAEAVVVASALADLIESSPEPELEPRVAAYIRDLKAATRR